MQYGLGGSIRGEVRSECGTNRLDRLQRCRRVGTARGDLGAGRHIAPARPPLKSGMHVRVRRLTAIWGAHRIAFPEARFSAFGGVENGIPAA